MTPTNPFLNASRAAFAELTTAEAQAWYRLKSNDFSAFLVNVAHRGISTVTRLIKPNSSALPVVPVVVENTAVEDDSSVPEIQEPSAYVALVPEVDSEDESVNDGLEKSETFADPDLGLYPSTHEQQETVTSEAVESAVGEAEDPEAPEIEEVSAADALDAEPTEPADYEDSRAQEAEDSENDSEETETELFLLGGSRAR